ncbi:MAG: hypothetical protein JWQ60_5419, partial [Pseudonocardia sp.]|nr:hypothetical protein [Pseudonocardia sp.]
MTRSTAPGSGTEPPAARTSAGGSAVGGSAPLPGVTGTRAQRRARLRWAVLPPVGALLLGLAGWQLVITLFGIPGYLLPSPATMLRTVAAELTTIGTPTWVTMREAYVGFLLAGVGGVLAGLVMSRWRLLERGL